MYSVLIVDDEPIEREAIRYFIAKAALDFTTVKEACNGIEAVERAWDTMPDIIIMDIRMPGKTGLEAAVEIRQFLPDCKFIFLTAYSEFDYAQKAVKIKAEDFIIKPAYSEDLIAVLRKVIQELDRKREKGSLPSTAGQESDRLRQGDSTAAILIHQVCCYIDANYSKNIRLEEMCDMAGFSKCYFCKLFKQFTGMNLMDYVTIRRIEKAKELLKDPKISIKEISAVIGYNDANYLTAVFKKWENLSPTEYRLKYSR